MNQTNSTDQTTYYDGIIFDWTNYVRMSLSFFGVVTNSINIWVFMGSGLKEASYRFMLAKSVANLLYLAIALVNEMLINCVNCLFIMNYGIALYTIVISSFLLNSLSFFRTMIDLLIVIHVFCILANKDWTTKLAYRWIILIMIAVTSAYNLFKPFFFWIYQVPNSSQVFVYVTPFGVSQVSRILMVTQSFIKIVLTSFVYPLINIKNIFLFRQRYGTRISIVEFTLNSRGM